jgi:hypothetical protein
VKPIAMDNDHTCHCAHVVILQTKVGIVQWMLGVLGVALVGTILTLAGQFITRRLTYADPPMSASERLFLDRINAPEPTHHP